MIKKKNDFKKDCNLDYYWKKKTILSFIAIFFIISVHNSAIEQYQLPTDFFTNTAQFIHNLLAYGIGNVAVPFFFFISGLTLFRNYKPKLFKQKMVSRVKTLLIPYLIWNLVGVLFIILATYTPLSHIIAGREQFVPTLENFLQGIFLYKYNYHYWFMFNLIIFVALTPIFHLILSRKWLGIIFIPIIFCLPLISESFLYISVDSIIFYYLGCFVGKYHLQHFISKKPLHISVLSGIISLMLIVFRMLSICQIINSPLVINQITIISLIVSLWYFSDIFISKSKAKKYTNEFFPVYTVHPYIIAVIIKIIYFTLPHTSLILLFNEIFSDILTLVITTVIVYVWHQKFPKIYSIVFGRSIRRQNNDVNIT